MAKQTAEISIVFKNWVNMNAALNVLKRLGLSQYQPKSTDKRKKSLVTLSIFVPPPMTEDVIKRLNIQEGVVKARKIEK